MMWEATGEQICGCSMYSLLSVSEIAFQLSVCGITAALTETYDGWYGA